MRPKTDGKLVARRRVRGQWKNQSPGQDSNPQPLQHRLSVVPIELLRSLSNDDSSATTSSKSNNRELTKRGRRWLRGLHLKIQIRVIHITTRLFHVVPR